jgi:hypothetical protein
VIQWRPRESRWDRMEWVVSHDRAGSTSTSYVRCVHRRLGVDSLAPALLRAGGHRGHTPLMERGWVAATATTATTTAATTATTTAATAAAELMSG